jgi:pyruvate/2-oxoglutarate dehydrogenase complex dihydrolipoamide acyltransferase (E2) component
VSKPDDDDGQVRPFAAVLQEIGGGKTAARLAAQLAELTAAVTATGKKGSITLKVEIKPVPKGEQHQLMVTAATAAKIPEPDEASPTSVFFATASGALTRDDPRQQTLPLVGLPGRTATG